MSTVDQHITSHPLFADAYKYREYCREFQDPNPDLFSKRRFSPEGNWASIDRIIRIYEHLSDPQKGPGSLLKSIPPAPGTPESSARKFKNSLTDLNWIRALPELQHYDEEQDENGDVVSFEQQKYLHYNDGGSSNG